MICLIRSSRLRVAAVALALIGPLALPAHADSTIAPQPRITEFANGLFLDHGIHLLDPQCTPQNAYCNATIEEPLTVALLAAGNTPRTLGGFARLLRFNRRAEADHLSACAAQTKGANLIPYYAALDAKRLATRCQKEADEALSRRFGKNASVDFKTAAIAKLCASPDQIRDDARHIIAKLRAGTPCTEMPGTITQIDNAIITSQLRPYDSSAITDVAVALLTTDTSRAGRQHLAEAIRFNRDGSFGEDYDCAVIDARKAILPALKTLDPAAMESLCLQEAKTAVAQWKESQKPRPAAEACATAKQLQAEIKALRQAIAEGAKCGPDGP